MKKIIEKGKKYTYEEIKEIFNEAMVETTLKPFGNNTENAKKEEINTVMASLIAVPIICTLQDNMFGDGNNE